MTTDVSASALFASLDEPLLAGMFEDESKGYFYRYCSAYAAWFRALPPPEYTPGDRVYPRSRAFLRAIDGHAAVPHYSWSWILDAEKLAAKSEEAAAIAKQFAAVSYRRYGYMHGMPHYSRLVREGIDGTRRRVEAREEGEEFREGLLRLLDAIQDWLTRCTAYLEGSGAPQELLTALRQVPMHPARSYYEGLVAWNWFFFLDGCDNLGGLDRGLAHLYRGEDMVAVIRQIFENVEGVNQWSCTLGPTYNEITRQALLAIRGRSRPLLVTEDMPEDLWRLAAENFSLGCTHPSFYNSKAIMAMLHERLPQIPEEELVTFCGGGCTETNLEGITRAGGTDADLNLLQILERCLYEKLESCPDFESFLEEVCRETERCTAEMLQQIAQNYRHLAQYVPNPMRTLFVDDCIEKGLDYNAGGARYTWTMNSDSGLINVIDSLAAVRRLIYEEKRYTPAEFLTLLQNEDADFYAVLHTCPCFGTDNEDVDALGRRYAERVYMAYRNTPPTDFIDAFFVTEHQFSRYIYTGQCVGPTPDGRHAGDATCDSVAALRGKATKGPTAMLCSAAKLPQHLADGISVLNLTLYKRLASDPVLLRTLVQGYFDLGGMQVQITVTSPEELQDAMEHPERHEDLVVRVGGYSEYFNRLTPELKRAVLERNIHG